MLQPKVKRNMGTRMIPSNLPMQVDNFSLLQLAKEIVDFKKEAQEEIKKAIDKAEKTAEETTQSLNEIKKASQKMEASFEEMTNEIVGILKEIKSQGLKGEKGEDADEEAIEQRLLDKIPNMEEVLKNLPTQEEIASKVIKMIPESKPSLKIIQESIDIDALAEKLKKEISISDMKDWGKKWGDIRAEISRSKQGFHGGGFNNIANASGIVSTGLDTLKFTGATVTQTGRTVTVAITGGGSFTPIAVTPTPDDTTLIYTAASAPSAVVVNGSTYINGTVAMGGTISIVGTTITLPSPVGDGGSIYAIS